MGGHSINICNTKHAAARNAATLQVVFWQGTQHMEKLLAFVVSAEHCQKLDVFSNALLNLPQKRCQMF